MLVKHVMLCSSIKFPLLIQQKTMLNPEQFPEMKMLNLALGYHDDCNERT